MLPFASVWKRVCLKNKRPCSFCGTMTFYQERIVPWLIHLSMRQRMLAPYRDRVVSSARGRVLEVGIGSGLNLPFYASTATEIIGLEPSPKLLEMANKAARKTPIPLRLVEGTAEAIPIEDHDVDAVVTTWTMCSIPEIQTALQEMRRVPRPGGRLFFVEYGRATEPRVRWWQDHLTPAWKHLSGDCHLNRAIDELVENAGFRIERLDQGYMRGPKPITFMYEGSARPQ